MGRGGGARRAPRATACSPAGVRKGDAFGILARNTLEWALFDFALAHVGAVGAAIYANSSPHDVHYVLEHSEAVGVLCEDDAQRAKVEEGRATLPRLGEVLTFDDLPALEEEGRAYREAHPGALDEAVAAIDEEDLFTFIYTSGTTGPPKGCMIRHRNYYAMVATVDDLPDHSAPGDVMLLYLPLAHNFGRLDAPLGPVRRLHDRVPARSARRRPGDAARCGRRSSRACRASTRRCTRPSRRPSPRRRASSGA